MSSINTNNAAMTALATLRNINSNLSETQGRISTGLKVTSAKDNAAYFSISETMKGDSGMTKAVNEGLTLTKNSISTARLGADKFAALADEFKGRVAFAQSAGDTGLPKVEAELLELVKQMETTIKMSTFNGDDMVNAKNTVGTAGSLDAATGILTQAVGVTTTDQVVTGVSRSATALTTTTIDVKSVDLSALMEDFKLLATDFATNAKDTTAVAGPPATTQGQVFLKGALASADAVFADAVDAQTTLGIAEKSIESQQEFLTSLSDRLDSGIGAMVDANMEEEAARLQALQVQQQLASQSLSIANQAPQNILSLFR